MKIAIDLDDVSFNIIEPLVQYHNKIHGTSYTVDMFTKYSLEEVWGGTREDALREIHDFYKTPEFRDIKPVLDAPEIIKELAKEHKLYAVTSRTQTVKHITCYQICKHLPGCIERVYHTNNFSREHVGIPKSDIFYEIGADIVIEDCLDHVMHIPDINIIIHDRPWNRVELPKNMHRAKTWKDIPGIVKKVA